MPDRKMSIIIPFLLFFLFFVPSPLTYADSKRYYNDPKSMIAEIARRGADAVVREIYNDFNTWNSLLRNIATGDELWLEVAVALQPGAQGGAYDMLRATLGEALENSPESVLRVTGHKYGTAFICGAPDIDDTRYGTYELALKAIKIRQERVRTIKNPELSELSEDCMISLELSKDHIARFYGVKK